MKWLCLAALIFDLVLVGLASYRYLTVPKSEVEKYQENLITSDFSMIQSDENSFTFTSPDYESSEEEDLVYPSSGELSDDEYNEDFDNKNISLDGDDVFEYDDQATKQDGLKEAMERKNAVFGGDN